MKQQKYPSSKIKPESILFYVDAFSYDDGSSTVEVQEWAVRSIRRKRGSQTRYGFKQFAAEINNEKYVNLIRKIKNTTWGKRSTRNGDFGWLPSIPDYYRKQFKEGDCLPRGVYTTKRAAFKFALFKWKEKINRCQEWIKEEDCPNEIAEWEEDLNDYEKELKLLKSRFTRLENNQKRELN